MPRIAIREFGIIQKPLAGATVAFYIPNEDGTNSGVKATLYAASTGTDQLPSTQYLDIDGMLKQDCWVQTPVMASLSNLPQATIRHLKKITENPTDYLLPITSAAVINTNFVNASFIGGTMDGTVIGLTTPAQGKFTTLTCASFFETSDRRLKDEIEPVRSALAKIKVLKPVTFRIKTTKRSRQQLGFIAQDVQGVLPESVAENNTFLSVAYLDFIALLVAGMQEQQVQIDELKNIISNIKA